MALSEMCMFLRGNKGYLLRDSQSYSSPTTHPHGIVSYFRILNCSLERTTAELLVSMDIKSCSLCIRLQAVGVQDL